MVACKTQQKAWGPAVKLAHERLDVRYNLANALKNLSRNKEAIRAYRRCIKINHGMTNAHFNLGGILKSMDRLVDAAAAYQSAIVCASLAQTPDLLQELRLNLRDPVAATPLCDGAAYARYFEYAAKAMWKKADVNSD